MAATGPRSRMPCRRTPGRAPWVGTPHARVTRLLHCNLGTKGSSLTSAGRQELRDKRKVHSSSAIGNKQLICLYSFKYLFIMFLLSPFSLLFAQTIAHLLILRLTFYILSHFFLLCILVPADSNRHEFLTNLRSP